MTTSSRCPMCEYVWRETRCKCSCDGCTWLWLLWLPERKTGAWGVSEDLCSDWSPILSLARWLYFSLPMKPGPRKGMHGRKLGWRGSRGGVDGCVSFSLSLFLFFSLCFSFSLLLSDFSLEYNVFHMYFIVMTFGSHLCKKTGSIFSLTLSWVYLPSLRTLILKVWTSNFLSEPMHLLA